MSPDLAQVVARICARVAPEAIARVVVLSSGVRVDIATGPDERRRWISGHQVLRELRLVGWRVQPHPDQLLVGRWSSVNLAHRVQTLTAGVQAMQEVIFTAEAVLAAVQRHYRAHHDAGPAEALAAAGAEVSAWYQRWPVRLAELEGFDREADRHVTQLLLARSQELERQVLPLCVLHRQVVDYSVAALGDLLPNWDGPVDVRARLLQRVGEHFAGFLPTPSGPAAMGES
ncbi:hypothetical protein [Nonomuraea sp. SYSU D8015]|uniref:hypothetical protein n=1 Tax=Nonomuraea sp. SYSU D8015 TaxID=2593644 RepID=UPI001660D320|nr:hypothetical protein [Nonomuraea sp. SYSU D8015]